MPDSLPIDIFRLPELALKMPGLTPALGMVFSEAASVCLEGHNHPQEIKLRVTGSHRGDFTLRWIPPDSKILNSHNDTREATERGATGIAIQLVNALLGLSVMQRSRIGTGFDYWLGQGLTHNVDAIFEKTTRLEVSGILHAKPGDINDRVREKKEQIEVSPGTPSCIVIVEFSGPASHILA